VSAAAVGGSGNLAMQGYKIAPGQQSCTINTDELLWSTAIAGGIGSIAFRPGNSALQTVTSWGPSNVSSAIKPVPGL